jgi:hypothetical protein
MPRASSRGVLHSRAVAPPTAKRFTHRPAKAATGAIALAVALALVMAPGPARAAAGRFDFYDRGPYREGVPRPAEVLGYEPGTFHTSYGNMERYVDALVDAAPDRVLREPFGRSYEFRERVLLVITSPENQARLEEIREASTALADPRTLADARAADRLIERTPVTVWLNYSIHGDESASFEAMAQVAYQLAAGEDSLTRAIRDHCVVLMNLAHNPDGHERFVTWINALGSGNPDPLALEQQAQQPWGIGGRTNHYQFDMNRDALAMSQVESRQMAAAFRRWRPQVFVDHHGQTASYFFPPTASPANPLLPLADVERWTAIFGRANAAAFDRYGWNYYVREVFDFFYPGYWDVWPTLQGAIGMTYETDGGGNLAVRRDDETIVTLLDGIERHFTASLATCATASAHRGERLRDFRRFALASIDEGRRGPVRGYAFAAPADPLRAAALAANLLDIGVEVQWAPKIGAPAARPTWGPPPRPSTGRGAKRPSAAEYASHRFEGGAYFVDLAQPAGRLARTLLEREAPLDSAFKRNQLEKYERNLARGKHAPKEGYDFYDITAWSLPIAYGIEAYALRAAPPGGNALTAVAPDANRPWEERLPDSLAIGVPVTARTSEAGPLAMMAKGGGTALDLSGRVVGGEARTAYVWDCRETGAARVALRLLQENFRVATATRPLRAGGRTFARGSFVARIERNPPELHERIEALAKSSGVTVIAAQTAYSDSGDTGIGSESIVSLKRPQVAILAGSPVPASAYGWLWFLFERRLGFRFTGLDVATLPRAELDRYNVIVVPGGAAASLAGKLGEGGIARLKRWVSDGGTLVCLNDAAEFGTLKQVGLSTAWPVGVRKKKDDDEGDAEEADADSVDRELDRRPEALPGTVFWADLDARQFVAFGYDLPRIPVLREGSLLLKRSREGANPAVFEDAPRLSGWAWPETERRMKGAAYAIDEPNGGGHAILIAGPVAFRAFWRSTERMLLNAVLYGPSLD